MNLEELAHYYCKDYSYKFTVFRRADRDAYEIRCFKDGKFLNTLEIESTIVIATDWNNISTRYRLVGEWINRIKEAQKSKLGRALL